jgi:hypothetical protein
MMKLLKKSYFVLGFVCHLCATSSLEAKSEPFLFGQEESAHILVNNRILAKVNGKAISVIDLMKKLDIMFYKQFPQYTSSTQARFQFYQANWKQVFDELVDKELILADAEENKLPVSSGDVRQEMEHSFGPNIIANLDKVGLTFDDAWKIIQGDITIRRMLYYRINAKAMRQVTPQDVRIAYEQFAETNIRPDVWTYRVISIRTKDQAKGAEAANAVHHLLTEEKIAFEDLPAKFKEHPSSKDELQLNVSTAFVHEDKEVSTAYKETLATLASGSFSAPVVQKSRQDKSTVFRIFYLEELAKGGPVPYQEVENKLKDYLTDVAIGKETKTYLAKLRRHFDVQEPQKEEIASGDFQPFTVKNR